MKRSCLNDLKKKGADTEIGFAVKTILLKNPQAS
jgi:hypothetical protein